MTGELRLPCPDLDEAVAFFVDRLGFRLERIFPADAPAEAVVAGHGARVCLVAARERAQVSPPAVVVTRTADTEWGVGRAGMRYRDLVPGRFGGALIASHIRIDEGGPVPDYVHHHAIAFQMIYCHRGWVRVVYEDQGPPLVLEPGDCVLQPPHIRHRVLECSPGLEVIEVGSPAEHETLVDHELPLPTAALRPQRAFEGQTFVHHVAAGAPWQPLAGGGEARDFGIAAATGGIAGARVIRGERGPTTSEADVCFNFVLAGEGVLAVGGARHPVSAGDAFAFPAGVEHVIDGDLERLEVTLPAAD